MPPYTVTLTHLPDPNHVAEVRSGLRAYNVGQVPELLDLPSGDIAIFIRNKHDEIQGGLFAEVDWGMMYVDLLWLDDRLRNQKLGKALLRTIEQTTLEYGLSHVYLMTTEFQALSFYQHLGYELFGTLKNRPQPYDYYYLKKMNIQPDDTDYGLAVTTSPMKADLRRINHGLKRYCEQFVDCSSRSLTGFIYGDGAIKGGIVGATYWDWYDLRYFWVADDLRGQGYGKQLLQLAETECIRRGLTGIVCDTADFQSLEFYQSQGFEVFATLPDRPPKHESYFLKKCL